MWIKVVTVVIAGGILCLDRTVIQIMVSRPVIAGPVIGFLLGDVKTGLTVGAFVELLWINRIPLGVYIPPNDTVVSILATGVAIIVGAGIGGVSRELVALAILVFVPVGIIAQKVEEKIALSNNALAISARELAEKGDMKGFSSIHFAGVMKSFLASVGVIAAFCVPACYFLLWLVPYLSTDVRDALIWIYYFIPFLGIAVTLTTVAVRRALPLFAILAVVCLFTAEFMMPYAMSP